MKTIVRQSDKMSLFIFANDEAFNLTSTRLEIGNPIHTICADCTTENCEILDCSDAPSDWMGLKYIYNGSWAVSPDWVEPVSQVDEQP